MFPWNAYRIIWCVSARPLHVLLSSDGGWTTGGVKVFCSLRTHYSTSVAQHIGTVLYLEHLPNIKPVWNLTLRPNHKNCVWGKGGAQSWYTAIHKNNKHFLNYVVMSLEIQAANLTLTYYKTLRLNNTKPRLTQGDLWSSKWFSQRPLLNGKQRGDKRTTYFNWDTLLGLMLMLRWPQLLKLEVLAEVYPEDDTDADYGDD
jgi:hypothetical protein